MVSSIIDRCVLRLYNLEERLITNFDSWLLAIRTMLNINNYGGDIYALFSWDYLLGDLEGEM